MSFRVRPAEAADYEAYTRLMPELHVDDPIPSRERWIAILLPGTLVLEEGDETVGYSWTKVFGDEAAVVNVVVGAEHRGRGAGRVLMSAIAERARAAGATRWSLNVKVDNVPALRLYERFGLARAYRSAGVTFPWDRLAALPRDGAETHARRLDPGDDEAFETTFGVVRGRLADCRAAGYAVLGLVEVTAPAMPAALAGFDPAFPGANPFSAARPTLAGPLLDAMRPHARPEDAVVKLLVARHPALVDALRDAGGTVTQEFFRMEGVIPT